MFKVTIDDTEYEVTFMQFPPHRTDGYHEYSPDFFRASFGTRCQIEYGNTLTVTATSELSPKDNFNRNTGRKVSMTKALKELFPDDANKREAFWNQYWLARGGKW